MAVKGPQLPAQPVKIENRVELTQQMIRGNNIFEIKLIEKTVLTPLPLTHHLSILLRITRRIES
jgi:hypothetical protein